MTKRQKRATTATLTVPAEDAQRLAAAVERMRRSGAWPSDVTSDGVTAVLRIGMHMVEQLTPEAL